jgi:uncharacterized heparinase superfamily protein
VRQLAGRLIEPLNRCRTNLPNLPHRISGELRSEVSFLKHEPWNRRASIKPGTFSFLNQVRELGCPVNWRPAEAPLLWQFNLHYFNYLHVLDKKDQADLCHEWIRANSIGAEPGWHPFPTSLRIVNWCKAGLQGQDILKSLYLQAAYLYRNLETHLLGNHLLENARALIFAGSYFRDQGEAPKWLSRGLDIYRDQTPEQILNDGGHFERSPMYHALMLEGYLDVLNVLPDEHSDRSWLAETAREMMTFIVSLTHPGERIALFNDATQEIAPSTESLCEYGERLLDMQPERKYAFPETGYFIHDHEGMYFVIDGGAIGPDYLPAHAHADIFSYELSVDGVLFFVDSGVYEYEAGDMRDYVRSTPAHNTVCVDNVDQAECWHSFRVARRYAPLNVSFHRDADGCRFEGTFDGYAHLIGDEIVHRRIVIGDDDRRTIRVLDNIDGQGNHKVESFIHLHPEVECVIRGGEAVLERDGKRLAVQADGAVFDKEKGWYCPEFGRRIENDVLVLRVENRLPQHLSCTIQY